MKRFLLIGTGFFLLLSIIGYGQYSEENGITGINTFDINEVANYEINNEFTHTASRVIEFSSLEDYS